MQVAWHPDRGRDDDGRALRQAPVVPPYLTLRRPAARRRRLVIGEVAVAAVYGGFVLGGIGWAYALGRPAEFAYLGLVTVGYLVIVWCDRRAARRARRRRGGSGR